MIPIKYENISFDIPYFFVTGKEGEYTYKYGAYTGDGKIVIPIENGILIMRGDLLGKPIERWCDSSDYIIYDNSLKPTHKFKDYFYGCINEIFKSDQSGGAVGPNE